MTTAVQDKPETAANSSSPSLVADLAATFYGPGKTETPNPASTPTTESDSGSAATSTKESAVSTEPPKPNEPPKGAEEKKDDETKGQVAANRRLGQENKDLKELNVKLLDEVRELKARLDGSYVEPPKPTPEQELAMAEFKGREQASRPIAVQLFGAEALEEQIYGEGSTFGQLVKAEVKANQGKAPSYSYLEVHAHPQPAVKAMHILNRKAFEQQWGEDPRQWVEKILADARPTIEAELTKKLTKTPTGSDVPTVTDARGDGGPMPREKSMAELFYGSGAK